MDPIIQQKFKFHVNQYLEMVRNTTVLINEYITDGLNISKLNILILHIRTIGDNLVKFNEMDFNQYELTQDQNVRASCLRVVIINFTLEIIAKLEKLKEDCF